MPSGRGNAVKNPRKALRGAGICMQENYPFPLAVSAGKNRSRPRAHNAFPRFFSSSLPERTIFTRLHSFSAQPLAQAFAQYFSLFVKNQTNDFFFGFIFQAGEGQIIERAWRGIRFFYHLPDT